MHYKLNLIRGIFHHGSEIMLRKGFNDMSAASDILVRPDKIWVGEFF